MPDAVWIACEFKTLAEWHPRTLDLVGRYPTTEAFVAEGASALLQKALKGYDVPARALSYTHT